MKKNLFVVVLLLFCLTAPSSALAFNFVDTINYGRNIFNFLKKNEPPTEKKIVVENKTEDEQKNKEKQWQEKYALWEKAYSKNDISELLIKTKEFTFTEEAINYFAKKEYNSTSSVASNLSIGFKKDLISVSGYSRLKPLQGYFSADIKIIEENGEPVVSVSKARLGRIAVPAFMLNSMINKELKNTKEFLLSGKDKKYPKIEVGDGFIKLSYK